MHFLDENILSFGYYPICSSQYDYELMSYYRKNDKCIGEFCNRHGTVRLLQSDDKKVQMAICCENWRKSECHETQPIHWKLVERKGNTLIYVCMMPLLVSTFTSLPLFGGDTRFSSSFLNDEVPWLILNACFTYKGKEAFKQPSKPSSCLRTLSIDEYENYREKMEFVDFIDLSDDLCFFFLNQSPIGHSCGSFSKRFWLRDSFLDDEVYCVDEDGKINHVRFSYDRSFLPYIEIDLDYLDEIILKKKAEEALKTK